jgi:hypothetical protein
VWSCESVLRCGSPCCYVRARFMHMHVLLLQLEGNLGRPLGFTLMNRGKHVGYTVNQSSCLIKWKVIFRINCFANTMNLHDEPLCYSRYMDMSTLRTNQPSSMYTPLVSRDRMFRDISVLH